MVLPFFELLFIHLLIESMHLSHFLNLVEVYYKTSLVGVVLFDTFSAEDC
jgi:hypothetical protein